MSAPIGNKNAEKWTLEEAQELFEKSLEMAKGDEYDFIGEIASELNVSRHFMTYLVEKFPELQHISDQLLTRLEANCFKHAKKGMIKEATAIVNLKSNYKWKDRADVTSDDKPIQGFLNIDPLSDAPADNSTSKDSQP